MSATYDGVEYEEGGLQREQGYSTVSRGEAVYIASFAFQGHQANRFRSYVWVRHVFRDGHMERLDGWVPVEVLGPQFFDMDATSFDEVEEALVVGQSWDNDVRVILFVRMAAGSSLDDDLSAAIKARIRSGATPRHVPRHVIAVGDIPRTRSGKITELAVRDIIHGRPVKNTEALANAEALDYFRSLPQLSE